MTIIEIVRRIGIAIAIVGAIMAIGGMFTLGLGYLPGELALQIAWASIMAIMLGAVVLVGGAIVVGICTYIQERTGYLPAKAK